jgi:hypothetical protein
MKLSAVLHLTNAKKRQLFFTKQGAIAFYKSIPEARRGDYYLDDYWVRV